MPMPEAFALCHLEGSQRGLHSPWLGPCRRDSGSGGRRLALWEQEASRCKCESETWVAC